MDKTKAWILHGTKTPGIAERNFADLFNFGKAWYLLNEVSAKASNG
jgi:hypothetical protein